MPISHICNREIVIAKRGNTVLEATQLMRQHHVGNVLVVDEHGGIKIPVGIVTNRDLVIEIHAHGIDPAEITLGDILAQELAVVKEDTGVFEAIQYMREIGVRRLPVVNGEGAIIGILAMDDLLDLMTEELSMLTKLVRHEPHKEKTNRL